MITAAEADEDEHATSVPLFNCRSCSALPFRLDNGVTPLSKGTVDCSTTNDRKPDFFSRKFSSGEVFDTLHILRMPVCTSVQKNSFPELLILALTEAVNTAQNRPLWRMLAISGSMHC